MRLPYRE
ncbi:hypothetical protein YPPY113_2507, partial [Yersinia pestis PY-113]